MLSNKKHYLVYCYFQTSGDFLQPWCYSQDIRSTKIVNYFKVALKHLQQASVKFRFLASFIPAVPELCVHFFLALLKHQRVGTVF